MKRFLRILTLILAAFGPGGLGFIAPASGQGTSPKSDLVVGQINFERVRQETDASSQKYWIFNVIVQVKNQGAAAAGGSKLLLERNSGPGGSFQQACATCLIDVGAISAGGAVTLPPRQFNNAGGAASTFRATADFQHAVDESNEGNNVLSSEFNITIADLDKSPAIPIQGKIPQIKALLPDLTVALTFENVTSAASRGKTTWTFDLVATVKNLGPGPAGACDLAFEGALVTDLHGYGLTGWGNVPALAAGAQAVCRINGKTYASDAPKKSYRAIVDCTNKITETNENNNIDAKVLPFIGPAPRPRP